MKFFPVFILSFLLLSLLPFIWNQFSFIEAGFPFPYLEKVSYVGSSGTGTRVSFIVLNLVYDLILAIGFAWIVIKIWSTIRNKG
ncbi:hypothetical protein ACVWYN_000492 [Pedobacter sp. UYP24]